MALPIKKIVLSGDNPQLVARAFRALSCQAERVGRLVLHGDVLNFTALQSGHDRLLLVRLDRRPFFAPETLAVLFHEANAAAYVDSGLDGSFREEFLSAACGRFPVHLARPEDVDQVASVLAVEAGLVTPLSTHDLAQTLPADAPLVPAALPPCYEGKVWGEDLDGRELSSWLLERLN